MDVMEAQTNIQAETAAAMTSLSKAVEGNTKLLQSKIWYLMFACICIAAFAIGLKLWPT